MDVFKYLFQLGIINLVFGFLWKWIVQLPTSLIFVATKFYKGVIIVKSIGAYFLVACTIIETRIITEDKSIVFSIVFYLIGMFCLLVGFSSNHYEAKKQAIERNDFHLMQLIKYDHLITFGSLILFVVIAFIPSLSINWVSTNFFEVVFWVMDIPVVNWIIGIGAVLYLLNILFYGGAGLLGLSLMARKRKPVDEAEEVADN